MGNYKLKVTDMIPSSWLYKLKEMSKRRKNYTPAPSSGVAEVPKPDQSGQRKSYYFTRDQTTRTRISEQQHLPVEPPRKSSTRRRRRSTKRNRLVSTSVTAGCSCGATVESVWTKQQPEGSSSSLLSRQTYASTSDNYSVLPVYGSDRELPRTFDGIDDEFEQDRLPAPKEEATILIKVAKEDMIRDHHHHRTTTTPPRGVRLRPNSPRVARCRKSSGSCVSESTFAVMKSSKDPRRDFRESMVEMILHNNIRASKDLEDLLACYLALNSHEYHHIIINVFKQIWFDFH